MKNPHTAADAELIKPWYRQFWPWFLIALPGSTVIAGIITVVIAVANGDALVTEDYYKAGITINTALAEVDRAKELGVHAQLSPVQERLLVVQLPADLAAPKELELLLRHPTQAGKDMSIRLMDQGSGRYTGVVEQAVAGRWQVVLKPEAAATDRWRLQGTWYNPAEQSLSLGISGDAASHSTPEVATEVSAHTHG